MKRVLVLALLVTACGGGAFEGSSSSSDGGSGGSGSSGSGGGLTVKPDQGGAAGTLGIGGGAAGVAGSGSEAGAAAGGAPCDPSDPGFSPNSPYCPHKYGADCYIAPLSGADTACTQRGLATYESTAGKTCLSPCGSAVYGVITAGVWCCPK
jgi:hypothetical protein